MERKGPGPSDWLLDALDPFGVGPFLLQPRGRALLAWAAASIGAAIALYLAWTGYNHPERPDGNAGHVYIDFAGQWLMGRMMVRGEGHYLYRREHLADALQDGYPREDADAVLGWLIESEEENHAGVSGPLYPPIHGLLFYPLGLLPPQPAYRVAQVVNLLLTFVIGFLAWKLTHGRVWASVAVGVLLLFPGYNGAISLGQNALLSLALLAFGWLLISRNRPWLGGAVWGLLAFKPVWAASFFLVPLLMRRWRVCVAMLLTGLALAVLTLPLVGWQTWLDWLTVGRAATVHYGTDESWIFLSRDLLGIPRRWLLDFSPEGRATNPDRPLPNILGMALWLTVAGATVLVALWRWRRPAESSGPAAAFLLLGAWLSCFHFMYYDVLLAALPVCLLFMEPRRGRAIGRVWKLLPPIVLVLLIVLPHMCDWIDYRMGGGRQTFHYPPFDTFCLLALWIGCGWRWLRTPEPSL